MSFLKHSDFALCKSSLIYFSGILGFNIHLHQWEEPSSYTQILAGLQFCIRVILLEYSIPVDQRDNIRGIKPTPLERFRQVHDPYLVEGREYPFNYIHKLLNYGMQVSKDFITRSRIRWSTDNKLLFWDGDKLIMEEWKEFVLKLLAETENMCATELLFQSDGCLPRVDLYALKDNPNRKEAGHYFAIEQPELLDDGRRYVLHNLKRSEKRNNMFQVENQKLKFLKGGVDSYETWVRKFKKLLCILMMVTCGQTGRGSELTSLLYMNTMNGDRSIYIEDGQVMFITQYHKSQAIMDSLKV